MIQLKMTFRDVDSSDFIKEHIVKRVQKLEHFYSGVIHSCHVIISTPHRHHEHGNHFNVEIRVAIPGRDIVITKEPGVENKHEDFFVTFRDAFLALERRLKVRVNKWKDRRGGAKMWQQKQEMLA